MSGQGVYMRGTEARNAAIVEQWRIGWSQGEIAKRLGTTRHAVAGVLSRAREAGAIEYRESAWIEQRESISPSRHRFRW